MRLTRATVATLRELFQSREIHRADGPVFQDTGGNWLRKSNVQRRSFQPIVQRTKTLEMDLAEKEGRHPHPIPEDFTIHGLRHTCATLLLQAGVDILTVSRRLGHAKPSTTLNVYGHAMKNSQERAAEALEGLLGEIGYKSATNVDEAG